jgi:hypothetical protein
MFTWRVRDPFGGSEVSCVKLPAAVAFPTDDRLLQRLEESRRALPPNSVKALWRRREPEGSVTQAPLHEERQDVQPEWAAARCTTTIEKIPARWTLPQTVHIEDVYARSRMAIGRR